MSYRVRRKFTSSEFFVDGQRCKIFFEPDEEFEPGFWSWNVGFAVGKSSRQLNDWYRRRNNRRARTLQGKFTGRSGVKAILKGFEEVRRLRWKIPPGDFFVLTCDSGNPEKQFRAYMAIKRKYPDIIVCEEKKEFYWHRPPFYNDKVWDYFHVLGFTPTDPLASIDDQSYFDCFYVRTSPLGTVGSNHRIADLSAQAQANE